MLEANQHSEYRKVTCIIFIGHKSAKLSASCAYTDEALKLLLSRLCTKSIDLKSFTFSIFSLKWSRFKWKYCLHIVQKMVS